MVHKKEKVRVEALVKGANEPQGMLPVDILEKVLDTPEPSDHSNDFLGKVPSSRFHRAQTMKC